MSEAPSEKESYSKDDRVDSARTRYQAAKDDLKRSLLVLRRALLGLFPILARTPRPILAAIALALLAFTAWWEARTPSTPWQGVSSYLWHWKTPRKLYDGRALPAFDHAVIESVEITPDGKRVWIAGEAGLLAFTEDEGKTWTQFVYDPARNTMVKKGEAQAATVTTALFHWTVEADQSTPSPTGARGTYQQQQPLSNQQPQQSQSADGKRPAPNPPTGLRATIQSQTSPSTAAPAKRRQQPRAAQSLVSPVTETGQTLITTPLKIPPDWREIHFQDPSTGWLMDKDDYALVTTDSGATWAPASSNANVKVDTPNLRLSRGHFVPRSIKTPWTQADTPFGRTLDSLGLTRAPSLGGIVYGIGGHGTDEAWAAGEADKTRAVIYYTRDGGISWPLQFEKPGLGLRDVVLGSNGKTGFAVGTQGAIFRTHDGGAHWDAITLGAYIPGKLSTDYSWWQQPIRIFSPLSMLEIAFGLLLLLPAVLPSEVKGNVERTIANITVSDAPVISATEDTLGFGAVARAISGLLRNKATKLPITAKWGRGKTSLMSMVQQDLKAAGWRTVWFNAWHHQEELSLLAALLQTVRRKAPPQMLERGGVQYRLRLIAARLLRWRTLWVVAGCLVLFQAESAVHEKHQYMYGCAAQYLYEQSGGVVSADENVCKAQSVATATNTVPVADAAKLQANAKSGPAPGSVAPAGGAEKKTSAQESTPSGAGAEGEKKAKPGILEFLMRLLFDMARQTERFETSPLPGVHIIPLLALSAFVLVLGWQVLQSFGANPAELLTAQTAHKTVSELEARTNFLEEFRKQYGDVVEALGKYRLVILIDDLDRCRPEKISEMLEASNYLMAAGKCAIVMALEEQAVMAGLGLSFQRMAEEMVDVPDGQSPKGDFMAETRYKRREFARNYVEKLLNVVVQVPVIDATKFGNSLAGVRVNRETPEQKKTRQRRKFASVVKVPAAAVIVLGGAFTLGSFLSEELNKPDVKKTVEATTASLNAPAPQTSTPAPEATAKTTATPAAATVASDNKPAAEATFFYAPAKVAIPQRWFATWSQRAGWLVVLLACVATVLARRPPPVTEDSQEFTRALQLWMPMLAEMNPSLRFGKRVLNRLRYLAMLERESEKDAGGAASMETPAQARIPQTLLVALGAMDATRPEVLQSESAFAEYLRALNQPVTAGDGAGARERMTWQMHQSTLGSQTAKKLEYFRQRFVNLSAGITAS
jgi:hypothetical protein